MATRRRDPATVHRRRDHLGGDAGAAQLHQQGPFLRYANTRTIYSLATGAGYLKGEYSALGVDHAERNDLFDEALDVLKAIWTSDDVSFAGRHFSARGITAHPRPVTEPHPPIWIGGNSGRARQRVAARGQGLCPFIAPPGLARTARTVALDSPEQLALAIDDLRRRLDVAGRDPASIDIAFAKPAWGNPAVGQPGRRILRCRRPSRRP
jgi:Luciferase-like monooxygenase